MLSVVIIVGKNECDNEEETAGKSQFTDVTAFFFIALLFIFSLLLILFCFGMK